MWPFAQKSNNCNSVRVTLRCRLLFAPSVTTWRCQWPAREALQMTVWDVGVMECFSKVWDSNTLRLRVLAVWIHAWIMICAGWTKMTLFLLFFLSTVFSFPSILKAIGRRHEPVCWHLFAAGWTEGLLFFRVCEPPKYLHAESQLHSMSKKTSKAGPWYSSFIGLCNHTRNLWVALLALWLCDWQERLLNPSLPLLPNDEQVWLWLCLGIRCQLLVRVRLAGWRLEAWHRCPLSGGLRSHSHTENMVHQCAGISLNTLKSTGPLFHFWNLVVRSSPTHLQTHTHSMSSEFMGERAAEAEFNGF